METARSEEKVESERRGERERGRGEGEEREKEEKKEREGETKGETKRTVNTHNFFCLVILISCRFGVPVFLPM